MASTDVLHPIHVKSRRAAGGKKFEAQGLKEGWTVFDVTSKSTDGEMRKLSPFEDYGDVPVPGMVGEKASSVERIWQGLKVFETRGEDLGWLTRRGPTGIKRTVRKHGAMRGHAWFGDGGGRVLLPYVEARKRIYLPAYRWVLEEKAQRQLRRIAEAAARGPVVLLDYTTNGDVEDARTPLSHASQVAAYVGQHWQRLLTVH